MPNINGAYGLRPSRHRNGGCLQTNAYSIASGYAADLFTGDPVVMTGTGRNIALAAAGTTNAIGVFAGCRYIDAEGKPQFKPYWPANTVATEIEALVYDDPNIIFSVQCDSLAEADVGQLCDWAAGTGNVKTGLSGAQAEGSAVAAIDKSLRILKLIPSPDNAYGAYAKAEVQFIEHALTGVVAGVGGN